MPNSVWWLVGLNYMFQALSIKQLLSSGGYYYCFLIYQNVNNGYI